MSGTLPIWLERWLGLAPGSGEGTAWRLEIHWPWPSWLTLLAALAAVAAVVAIYLREGRQASRPYRLALAAMRLGLVALVLAMIAQVELLLERTGLPYVAVLLDDSRSMTTVDSYPQQLRRALEGRVRRSEPSEPAELSRWNLARTLLAENRGEFLSALAENYKLRFYFLTGVKASRQADVPAIVEELRSAEPLGDSTRLGAAVRSVLDEFRGATPAAIVLVTDGINTEGPSLAEAAAHARRRGVPLFFVALGSDEPVHDLRLSDLLVEDVVFVNDVVDFRFRITGSGFAGKKVGIVLRKDGRPEVLARIETTLGADGRSQELRLPYRPTQVGQFRYTIDVEPPEGGLPVAHAPLARSIQVRQTKIRVLLAHAYPSFEYRFLRNMLARDETIELRTVLQDADVEYAAEDKAALAVFPVRRDDLFSYDLVILGDVNPALLGGPILQNLADFVNQPGKGGALVLLAGPHYMPQAYRDTPLAPLLPFDLATVRYPDPNKPLVEGFVVEPTELGLASPPMQLGDTPEESRTIWRSLAKLYWMVEVPDLKPAARVLAETPSRSGPDGKHLPVIVLQYVGAGKVLFHASDETFRWRRRVGDVFFARYWIQMIRYLTRSKLAEGDRSARLSSDRREYQAGDPVRLQVRFSDERLAPPEDNGVTVMLESPGRKTEHVLHRVEAGRGIFEGVLRGLPAGAYHASIAVPAMEGQAPAADFTVAAPQGEMARIQMDAAAMRQAADMTKGRFYALADAGRLPGDLPEGRQVPIESLPPMPLWNQWPLLLAFLVLLTGEWILRKRGGMV
jgi:hypothetical protein